jgi:membrane protein implicated in regulation of membrane protease activity
MLFNIWSFLTAWYNLPFTVLLGLSIFVALMQLSGLGGDDDSNSDLDHDVDAGDLDHDVDMGHDADLDHDLDHDVSHEADHDADAEHGDAEHGNADHGDSFSPLSFLGIGKAPLLVVLMILFASVGLVGWLLNGVSQAVLGAFPGLLVCITLPVAGLVGTLLTSRAARLIGQLMPPLTTTASRAQALVGMTGTVTSPFVDEKYGMVRLRDAGSTMITIFATTEEAQPIPRGEQVLLVSYDATGRRYRVTRK